MESVRSTALVVPRDDASSVVHAGADETGPSFGRKRDSAVARPRDGRCEQSAAPDRRRARATPDGCVQVDLGVVKSRPAVECVASVDNEWLYAGTYALVSVTCSGR